MLFAVWGCRSVLTTEFTVSYACPGFYPLMARDLVHAATLFALWKARRIFGPGAICAPVILREEIAGGGRFEVRLFKYRGGPGKIYRFTVIVERDAQMAASMAPFSGASTVPRCLPPLPM